MSFFVAKRQGISSASQLDSMASPTILTAPKASFATAYNFSTIPTPSETSQMGEDMGLDGPGTSGGEKAIIITCILGAGLVIAFLVMYMTLKRQRQSEYAEKTATERGDDEPARSSGGPAYLYHSSASDHDDYYLESALPSPKPETRYVDNVVRSISAQSQSQRQNLPNYTQSRPPTATEAYRPAYNEVLHMTGKTTGPQTTTYLPEYKDENGGPPFQQPRSTDPHRYTVDSIAAASMDSAAIHGHKPHYTSYADLLTKSNPYSPSIHTRGRANSIASSKFDHNAKRRQSSQAPTIPTRRNSYTSPADLALALPPMIEATFTTAETPTKSPKSSKSMYLFPQPLKPTKKSSDSTLNRKMSMTQISAISSPTMTHASSSRMIVSPVSTHALLLSPISTHTSTHAMKNQNINDAYRDSTLWQSQEQEHQPLKPGRVSSMLSRQSQEMLGRGGIGATFETVDWQSIDWNAKIGSTPLKRPRSSIYSELGAKEEDDWEAHRRKVIAALQSRYWANGSVISKDGRVSPVIKREVGVRPVAASHARQTFGRIEALELSEKEEGSGMVASITEVKVDNGY